MTFSHVVTLQAPPVVGYRDGLRQPAQRITLCLPRVPTTVDWTRVDDWLLRCLEVAAGDPLDSSIETVGEATVALGAFWRVLLTARRLMTFARMPVFETGKLLRVSPVAESAGAWQALAAIPQIDYAPDHWTVQSFEAAAQLVSVVMADPAQVMDLEALYAHLERSLIGPISAQNPIAETTHALLAVAHGAGIPWRHQGAGIVQLGWGRQRLRLRASALDRDSLLGEQVAGHKFLTSQWLRRAGIPVAEHVLVNDEASAVAAASTLGGELVVKPANSVGGQGVSLRVHSEAEVRAAFRATQQPLSVALAPGQTTVKPAPGEKLIRDVPVVAPPTTPAGPLPQVLVERYVPGQVYHVQVAVDAVLYVSCRHPAAVMGDGTHSVAELVALENARRSRQVLWQRRLPLPHDAAALACLQRAGWSLESILPPGKLAYLRDIPTNADGAWEEDASSRIHPDNAALAVRAAQLLKLGLAGIDIISPDISVPWHVNGAIINEVNHAPLLGAEPISQQALPTLVGRLVGGQGRIPVEVWVGGEQAVAAARARQAHWRRQQVACYLCYRDGVEDDEGKAFPLALTGLFQSTRALLAETQVEALALVVQDDEWLDTGLPVDRISRLERVGNASLGPREADLLALLAAHTDVGSP